MVGLCCRAKGSGAAGSAEVGERRAEIDVVRHAVDHERRDRLDAGLGGLADTRPVLAEVHHFDVVPAPIERAHELLLGGDAHGTASVIKYGLLHGYFSVVSGSPER